MNNFLERMVFWATKKKIDLNHQASGYAMFQFFKFILPRIFRGFWHKIFLQSSQGFLLVGRGVSIRNPQYISLGKNCIIEDYAEIQGISKFKISIGNNVTIGKLASIRPSDYYLRNLGDGLDIGDNSNIGAYSYIGCSGKIEIGKNVMISPRVSMYAENHNFSAIDSAMKDQGVTREKIKIEDNCWIAANSVILAGITIGEGSIVSAGSIVTKNVPPFSIVGGVPAKVIKIRTE